MGHLAVERTPLVSVAAVVGAVVLIPESMAVAGVESAPMPGTMAVVVFGVALVETAIKSSMGVVEIVSSVSGLGFVVTVSVERPKVSAGVI